MSLLILTTSTLFFSCVADMRSVASHYILEVKRLELDSFAASNSPDPEYYTPSENGAGSPASPPPKQANNNPTTTKPQQNKPQKQPGRDQPVAANCGTKPGKPGS
jgi:hypothetical protein